MSTWLEQLVGASAFSVTTASFVQPAVNSNVTVRIEETGWAAVGQGVFVAGGGYYSVVSVGGPKSLVLKNIGGSANAAPATTVATGGTISPAGLPGSPGSDGNSAGYVPVTVMIDGHVTGGDVTNLSAGPTSWAGYTLQPNDQVGLANQSNSAHIGTATYHGAGVFTMNSTQPPDHSQLITTQGSPPLQAFVLTSGSIGPLGSSSSGTIVGANGTVCDFAPDPAGGNNKAFSNPSIDVQTLVATTPKEIWRYDFGGHTRPHGLVWLLAAIWVIDETSTHVFRARIETLVRAGTPPTAHYDGQQDDLDDSGNIGDYCPLTWSISGNAIVLTATSTINCTIMGFVSFGAGAP